MRERLQEIKSDYNKNFHSYECLTTIENMNWLIETIENQQAEIETLSMAHDNLHRGIEKDKHSLIKSNIALNRQVQELKEENERYIEVIESIEETANDYRNGNLLDIQDSFFVDEIIAISNLEGEEQ